MQSKVIDFNIAIGLSKSKPAKVRETLNWALQHDTHPAVRAEAIRAVSNLGLIQEEQLKNGVMTLLTADSCEKVRREAEKALSKCSVIYKTVSDDSREVQITVDGNPVNPYPHILSEKTKEEAQIFLRNSLVNDQEATNVIDQVRSLSTKEAIFKQVEEMSVNTDQVQVHGLDLDFDATFRPSVKEIHKFATKKKYLEDIEYDRDGIPVLTG
jgi:hypothetical protein